MNPLGLSLHDLSLQLRGRRLLGPIDAMLPAGAITAIIGPNGAGKSTLLRCLAGLQSGWQGRIQLGEHSLAQMPVGERARRLGWLGQFQPNELPLNLFDYVLLGRRPSLGQFGQPRTADRQAVEQALAQVELATIAARPWRQLSGGERQRGALARLLVQDAPIWLLDEPCNHLDLKHEARLLHQLREQASGGRTIVTVIHDLAQAARWADHVLLLHEGRLLAQGTPSQALSPALLSAAYQWPVALRRHADGDWQVQVGPVPPPAAG